MSTIQPDPSLIKNIKNNACNVCQEGSSYNVCMVPPESLVNNNLKCNTKCSDQYNAISYFYDKDGTKRCYCGKTKVSCEQASSVSKICDGNQTDMCILQASDYINGITVPDNVNTDDVCKIECKKILKSDGLYCSDTNKCFCTNPLPFVQPIPPTPPTPSVIPSCDSIDSKLYCSDNTPIQSSSNSVLPDTYMKYGDFLGSSNQNNIDDIKTAFCDCDNDIALSYNNYFPTTKPTLGSIWVDAVKKSTKTNNKNELYNIRFRDIIKMAY